MTSEEQEAFRKITEGPELQYIGKPEPLATAAFYGALAAAIELLGGGVTWLITMEWRFLVGTLIAMLATLLVAAAVNARKP